MNKMAIKSVLVYVFFFMSIGCMVFTYSVFFYLYNNEFIGIFCINRFKEANIELFLLISLFPMYIIGIYFTFKWIWHFPRSKTVYIIEEMKAEGKHDEK